MGVRRWWWAWRPPPPSTGPWVLTFLLTAGTAGALAGQAPSVERAGPLVRAGMPGEALTIPFRVLNGTGRPLTVNPILDLPAGWHLAVGTGTMELEPMGEALRLISVRIPDDAPAGVQTIRLRVGTPGVAPSAWSLDSAQVAVESRPRLEAQLLDVPLLVPAGDEFEVTVVLRNSGNVTLRPELELRSALGFTVELLEPPGDLGVGESVEVRARVVTGALAGRPPGATRDRLQLRASAGELVHSVSTNLDVIPRGTAAGGGPFNTLPLKLRITGSSPAGSALPFELAGGGHLTDTGSTRLDVLARGGPRETRLSGRLPGQQDEYRVLLSGEGFSLEAGDQVFRLSRLTEPGVYDAGLSASIERGPFTLGAHRAVDRRYGRREQTGGFLEYGLGPAAFRAGALDRQGYEAGRMWSLSARSLLPAGAGIEVEHAAGAASERGTASSVEVRRDGAGISGHLRMQRADPDFPGRVRGTERTAAGFNIRLVEWLRARGEWARSIQEQGVARAGSRRNETASVQLSTGRSLSLELRSEERLALGVGPFLQGSPQQPVRDERSRWLRVRSGLRFGSMTLDPWGEMGWTLDRLRGEEHPFTRVGVRGGYRSGSAHLSASVEAFDGRRGSAGSGHRGSSVSLGAGGPLGSHTHATLTLAGSRSAGPAFREHGVLDALLVRSLAGGHALEARVRAVGSRPGWDDADPTITLTYTIPLAVPVSRSRLSGQLLIRLVDAGGRPLEGVRVTVAGQAVITDGNGRAAAGAVTPGIHRVEIIPAIGSTLVPAPGSTMEVEVRAGRRTEVEIRLDRGAAIVGTVILMEEGAGPDSPDGPFREAGAFHNAVAELTSPGGGGAHRRTPGLDGRFRFDDLPPGTYLLRVRASLPPWHRIEGDSLLIRLEAGDTAAVVSRVVPVPRVMRMLPLEGAGTGGHTGPGVPLVVGPVVENEPRPAGPRSNRPPLPAGNGQGSGGGPVGSWRVGEGDLSLMNIARKVYGDVTLWPRLWGANREELPDPDLLRPGQVLRVPPASPLEAGEVHLREEYYRSRGLR